MCGLFGFVNYSNKEVKGLSDLTNALAEHSSIRGTDATGISFVSGGMIRIIKEAKAAEEKRRGEQAAADAQAAVDNAGSGSGAGCSTHDRSGSQSLYRCSPESVVLR